MNYIAIPKCSAKPKLNQVLVTDLENDLLTVLEAHCEDLDPHELFFHCFRFLTGALYHTTASDKEALMILREGTDQGKLTNFYTKRSV